MGLRRLPVWKLRKHGSGDHLLPDLHPAPASACSLSASQPAPPPCRQSASLVRSSNRPLDSFCQPGGWLAGRHTARLRNQYNHGKGGASSTRCSYIIPDLRIFHAGRHGFLDRCQHRHLLPEYCGAGCRGSMELFLRSHFIRNVPPPVRKGTRRLDAPSIARKTGEHIQQITGEVQGQGRIRGAF